MGGTKRLGPVQFPHVEVDGHDLSRSSDPGALDSGHADTASTDNQNRGAGGDLGGVQCCTYAGGDTTAHQCSHVQRNIGIDLDSCDSGDDRLLGERATARHRRDDLVAPTELLVQEH